MTEWLLAFLIVFNALVVVPLFMQMHAENRKLRIALDKRKEYVCRSISVVLLAI